MFSLYIIRFKSCIACIFVYIIIYATEVSCGITDSQDYESNQV